MEHATSRSGEAEHRFLFVNLSDRSTIDLIDFLAEHSEADHYQVFEGVIGRDGFSSVPDLVILYSPTFTPWSPLSEAEIIASQVPSVPVAVMTDSEDLSSYRACYAYGVRGVLHTGMDARATQQALRLIAAGGTFVPARMFKSTWQQSSS